MKQTIAILFCLITVAPLSWAQAARAIRTYHVTNGWDAVEGATGYELGVGIKAGEYTRLISVGTNLLTPIVGLFTSNIYHIAVRAHTLWATGQWSAELIWPWPWTNTITVPPGSEVTSNIDYPDWQPMKTNVIQNPTGVAFYRGAGSTNPISISITNNVTGWEHRD